MQDNHVQNGEEQTSYSSKPLTLAQNLILTAKVLAGSGAVILLIWWINESKAVR